MRADESVLRSDSAEMWIRWEGNVCRGHCGAWRVAFASEAWPGEFDGLSVPDPHSASHSIPFVWRVPGPNKVNEAVGGEGRGVNQSRCLCALLACHH